MPSADTLTAVALVITATTGFFGAIFGFVGVLISLRNGRHLEKVEVATNGMKDELVHEVRKAATAIGFKQGRAATAKKKRRSKSRRAPRPGHAPRADARA